MESFPSQDLLPCLLVVLVVNGNDAGHVFLTDVSLLPAPPGGHSSGTFYPFNDNIDCISFIKTSANNHSSPAIQMDRQTDRQKDGQMESFLIPEGKLVLLQQYNKHYKDTDYTQRTQTTYPYLAK